MIRTSNKFNRINKATVLLWLGLTTVIASQEVSATESNSADVAEHAIGLSVGSQGLGISYVKRTEWHWLDNDRLQMRFMISGLSVSDLDDIERNDIKYDSDIDLESAKIGLDWYPMNGRFTKNLFVSSGLAYSKLDFDGTSNANQAFKIGGANVPATANVRLHTVVERSALSPYVSIGWGNRIKDRGGFAFFSEVGFMSSGGDVDVSVSTVSSTNLVSDADLASERKAIKDDMDGIIGFANLGISYQF